MEAPDSNRNRLSSIERVSVAHPALGFHPPPRDHGKAVVGGTSRRGEFAHNWHRDSRSVTAVSFVPLIRLMA